MKDSSNPFEIERRSGKDRRNKAKVFTRYLFAGKRGIPRREADRGSFQIVERYSAKVLTVILVIIGLSLLDAIFTLLLIDRGARELNPVMAVCLEQSPFFFISVKYLLTSASVIILLFIKDAYLFKSRTQVKVLFFVIMIPFILVIPWQLHMLFNGF